MDMKEKLLAEMLWRTMATEKPELYKQVTAYLDKKAQAAP